ncbi:MauE/DoxX family redox-associated membrane protein [Flagellimonas sp.]|uniref:MauE/DoxX family redox-associated membrane protein n=1 Tax=Flagellimonas sp. TaxID=2058762 RepID=UPI003BA9D71A
MAHKGYHSIFITLSCVLLTLLFVYTAVSKLQHLDLFLGRLERMPFIAPFASLISWMVPLLELVITGLLWFPKYRKLALQATLVLLGLFTAYIGIVLTYSDSIPCSCGGVISALGWRDHILFNATFMLMTFLGIIWHKKDHNIQTYQNTT